MKTFTLLFFSCLIAAALQAQVIHVPADYPSIQQGINAANPGDTVLVSDGTYYEQINFLGKKPLMVASEFLDDYDTNHIANTIIDGSQAPNPDSASVVYFISGEDTTSVLCGFTITGGKGTLTPYPTLEGGGIFLYYSGATFRNNRITGNIVDDSLFPECLYAQGGGISNYLGPNDKWVILENNDITYNSLTSSHIQASAGGVFIYGSCRIVNNTIKGNTVIQISDSTSQWANSGGICCVYDAFPIATAVIRNNKVIDNTVCGNVTTASACGAGALIANVEVKCSGNEFTGNKIINPTIWGGGGMFCEALADGSLISGNSFRNNETPNSGGGMFIGWTQYFLTVENNYFFNNSAGFGGGISVYLSTVTLQNNVFYSNDAGTTGGAINLTGQGSSNLHKACIINCSFSENSASIGGAINAFLVSPLILNSVFWNDTADYGPEIQGNCQFVEIAYSDIDTSLVFNQNHDILLGDGIINEDPLFTDTLLNISPDSPCLDAGIAGVTCHGNTWEAPDHDLAGIPRPQSGGFDMGAYEIMFAGIPGQSSVVSRQSLVRLYPNPAGGIVNCQLSTVDCQLLSLKIYDIHGREVAVVLDQILPAGEHTVQFDVSGLPAGIYFYQLAVGSRQLAVGKMIKF